MRKVLITGALGFIGRKLAEKFLNNGDAVIGWDIASGCCLGVDVCQVDLRDEKVVLEQLKKVKPDIIIHCAGSADVGKSVQFPDEDYHGNVTVTHNLLFALHKSKMTNVRFVFLSSAGVYGNPLVLPITEDMPVNPLSPYAVHKVMCEELCRYFVKNYGIDIKVARIFSAYGQGLKKQIFWDMYNKLKNIGCLEMFGTGNESRDYIHVNDLTQAIYLIALSKTEEIFFNVANGEEVTIREATEMFARCAKLEAEKILFNGVVREGDPLNWRADISKILSYFQWVSGENGS